MEQQTLILEKYTNVVSNRIGLTITESFITSTDDSTLLDNATGSSNENATGAHRFKIDLTLFEALNASFLETGILYSSFVFGFLPILAGLLCK